MMLVPFLLFAVSAEPLDARSLMRREQMRREALVEAGGAIHYDGHLHGDTDTDTSPDASASTGPADAESHIRTCASRFTLDRDFFPNCVRAVRV